MSTIPGYIATLTIAGAAMEGFANTATLNKATNAIEKTTFGVASRVYINGLKDTTVDIDMHLDTDQIVALQAADDATEPVAVVFRAGSLGANDAGSYAGDGIITSMVTSGAVDDNWAVSVSIQGTGPWPFTGPV